MLDKRNAFSIGRGKIKKTKTKQNKNEKEMSDDDGSKRRKLVLKEYASITPTRIETSINEEIPAQRYHQRIHHSSHITTITTFQSIPLHPYRRRNKMIDFPTVILIPFIQAYFHPKVFQSKIIPF